MKHTTTKRALLLSVLSMLLCCAMLVGSTFAWFTDSVTSAGNKIVAGNLKVDLIHVGGGEEGADVSIKETPDHLIFNYDKWEPGYTTVETLRVENKGNLAFKFRLDAVAAGATDGPNGEKLADVIDVYVYEGSDLTGTTSFADMTEANGWRNAGSLSALMADSDGMGHGVLLPTGAEPKKDEPVGFVQMTVALHMQESAGNAYQGLTLGDLNFNLRAAQYTYEDDSFGDQYDAGAKYPVTTSKQLVEALDKAKPGDEILLSDGDYEIPEEFTIAEGVTITGKPGAVLNVSGGKKDITTPNPETGITQGLLLENDNITISGVTIGGDVRNVTGDKYTGYNALVRITGNNVTLDNVTLDSKTNDSPIVIANTTSADNIITIKDCKLTAAFKAIHIVDGTVGTVVIDGCNIDAVYPINVNTNSQLKLSIKDSVLKGFTSYGPSVIKAVFDNCEFGVGHGQRYVVAYADTDFINCKFNEGFLAQTKNNHNKTMSFTNCTKAGTKITAENVKAQFHADSDRDSIDQATGWTVLVDGVAVS